MTPLQSAIDRLKRLRAGEGHHDVYPNYDHGMFRDHKLIADAVLDGSLVADAVEAERRRVAEVLRGKLEEWRTQANAAGQRGRFSFPEGHAAEENALNQAADELSMIATEME